MQLKFRSLIIFFFLLLNSFSIAQKNSKTELDTNYFPLANGNKWQFIKITQGDNLALPFYTRYEVVNYSVTEECVSGAFNFYKYNYDWTPYDRMRYDWMRYDTGNKIIYYQLTNDIFFNTNLTVGSTFLRENINYTVVDSLISLWGNTSLCKGFYRINSTSDFESEAYYYMNNIGLVAYHRENFNSSSYKKTDYKLIGAYFSNSSQGNSFIDSAAPEISFLDAKINYGNMVDVTVKINHKYSVESSYNDKYIYGVSYINDANIQYYYSNGIDSIAGGNTYLWQLTETQFQCSLNYNADLILQGYNMFYKVSATDMAINPHTSYFPQTGYKKLEISNNFYSDFYPLRTGNKWVYDVEEYNLLTGSHHPVNRMYVYVLNDTTLSNGKKYYKVAYNNDICLERVDLPKAVSYKLVADSIGLFSEKVLDVLDVKLNGRYKSSRFSEADSFKCIAINNKVLFDTAQIFIKRIVNINDPNMEYTTAFTFGIISSNYYEYINGEKKYFKAKLKAAYINGTAFGDSALFVGINENISDVKPNDYILSQNYPNPFNPSTTIEFNIPQQGDVKLTVYDILGKEINTLINKNLNAGNYSVNFDGTGLSSGIYFYTLKVEGKQTITKKMVLTK